MIFLVGSISAEYIGPVCFPPPDDDLLCRNAYRTQGDELDNWDYLYCDVDDVITCPQGCSNGECTGGTPQICTNGYERCCQDIDNCPVEDPDGDIYRCVNGQWKLIEECGENPCKEQSFTHAICEEKIYYCVNIFNCFWSTVKQDNCYETLEECQKKIPIYCVDESLNKCFKRFGSCKSGEKSFQGTSINDEWCDRYGIGQGECQLKACEECGEGILNLCDEKECNLCFESLGCKFEPAIIGGKCESTLQPCESCFSWLKSFFSEEDKCEPQLVEDVEILNPGTWRLLFSKKSINQNDVCPIYFVSIIGFVVLLVFVIIGYNKRGKKGFLDLTKNQKYGLLFMIIAFLIWLYRPFQGCSWYQIGCKAGSFATTIPILGISLGLGIFGFFKLIKKNGK